LVAQTGWRESELRAAVDSLVQAGKARRIVDSPLTVVSVARLAVLSTEALKTVEAFHHKEPLLEGIPKRELKERVFRRAPDALFASVLADLAAQGQVTVASDRVKRAGREVKLSREEADAKAAIEQAFARAGLSVPTVKEVLAKARVEAKRAQKIIHILLRDKVLVRVSEELLFHQEAVGRLEALLRDYKRQQGDRISVAAFKQLTGVTRKYAIPLLEYLDRRRLTRRVGDVRVLQL